MAAGPAQKLYGRVIRALAISIWRGFVVSSDGIVFHNALQAAIDFFGSAANLIYCNNFDEVFHATAAGTAQFGVVGMENSTEGVVARSLDLFLRSPVHVIGEISLMVRHNLLRQSNSLDGIEVVLAQVVNVAT